METKMLKKKRASNVVDQFVKLKGETAKEKRENIYRSILANDKCEISTTPLHKGTDLRSSY